MKAHIERRLVARATPSTVPTQISRASLADAKKAIDAYCRKKFGPSKRVRP